MDQRRYYFDCGGIKSDNLKGINRRSIFMSRTEGVDEEEYFHMKKGLEKIILETGVNLDITDYGNFRNTSRLDYNSPDWYQEKSMTNKNTGFGPQVSAQRVAQLLINEPYQDPARGGTPHFDFMVLDRDMTLNEDDGLNYIFGYGPYPLNIVSTKRFSEYIKEKTLRCLSLGVISAHEFCHNLNLVRRNFNIGSVGLEEGHCLGKSGPCLMEQSNIGKKTVSEITKLIIHRVNWLCPDCTEEIRQKRIYLSKFGINF